MKKRLTTQQEFEIMKLVLDKFLWLGFIIMGYGVYQMFTSTIPIGLMWIVAVLMLLNPQSVFQFGVAGSIGGAMLGTIWTANRPMILRLAPRMKPGQFFGFDELADKFSGAIEPILFGWLVVSYGYTMALWSLMVFFVIGLVLLYWVPS